MSIYVQNFIPNSCLLYPAAAVRNKAFDEALALNEDWDFLLNAIESEGGHKHPLVHVSVVGPIIHKTDRARADRRGAVNDHLLPDNMLAIYRKYPAPTNPLKAARQVLFASVGIKLPRRRSDLRASGQHAGGAENGNAPDDRDQPALIEMTTTV